MNSFYKLLSLPFLKPFNIYGSYNLKLCMPHVKLRMQYDILELVMLTSDVLFLLCCGIPSHNTKAVFIVKGV